VPGVVRSFRFRPARDRWGINSYLVGWHDQPELAAIALFVEQLAGT
jgi:hypothetical protein